MGDVDMWMSTAMRDTRAIAQEMSEVKWTWPEGLKESLTATCKAAGVEATPDNLAHARILVEALRLYGGRSATYGQGWRDFGAIGQALNLGRKGKRVWSAVVRSWGSASTFEAGLDDARDCINYGAFFIRCKAEGNAKGETK